MLDAKNEKILLDLVNEFSITDKNMFIKTKNGKYIMGLMSRNKNEQTDKLYQYNHFLESIRDISRKAKISIDKSLKLCKQLKDDFNPFNNKLDDNEYMCYYFLENALYRLEILWDSLAQVYNLYADENIAIDRLHYKNFFNNLLQNSEKNKLLNVKQIGEYLFEDDASDDCSFYKGVHKYIYDSRNVGIHRYSLVITSFSNNIDDKLHMRDPAPFLLCKIGYDYNKVMKFLTEIFDLIFSDNQEVIDTYNQMLENIYK